MLAVPLAWYLGTFNFNGYLDEIYGWNDCRQENQGNVDRLQRFSAAFLPGLIAFARKADIGLNNLMYIKRDFCVKIVMKNVRKLQIKAYKT